MISSRKYYTLIGSLPALPVHFEDAQRLPISQIGLQDRLKMLDDDGIHVCKQVGDFLLWERQPLDRTDEDVSLHYDDFMQNIQNAFARRWIDDVMTMRTIVSAFRRRRLGMGAPLGVGWSASHIARNWSHPDFRLTTRLPWVADVDAQLSGDMPFQLERILLDIKWRHAKRLADHHQFTFEAVLLYLIRWEIISRWTARDTAAGQEKFERLVANAMGSYANMYDS